MEPHYCIPVFQKNKQKTKVVFKSNQRRYDHILIFIVFIYRGAFSEVYMVRERKTGKTFAMKCVKKKKKRDINLENEIAVLRRYCFIL